MSTATTTIKAIFLVTIIFCFESVLAGGIDNLAKYFENGGSMTNVTKSAVVKDQQSGYITGGSLIMRGPPPKTLNPLLIQTPKFALDACTGSADFRFGGLSYISSKELTQFLKRIPNAAGAYGVKMLLKTVCPQCEDILMDLESIARSINGLMMDQCAAGQMIAKGVFGALTNSGQQQCMMQGNASGSRPKDMYDATDKCKTDPDRYGDPSEQDNFKSLLGNEFNLVWKALGKEQTDSEFKELIMSISGTIVGRKVNGAFEFKAKPSLIVNDDMIEQYIGVARGASKLKKYKCDNAVKCLEPTETEVTLGPNDSFYGNVSRILEGIAKKIIINAKNASFNDEEETLISFTSFPILALIEGEVANKSNKEDVLVRLTDYVEIICYDVVTNFLEKMVSRAQTAVETLKYSQVSDSSVINDYIVKARDIRSSIANTRNIAFKRAMVVMQMKQRIAQQQTIFRTNFAKISTDNTI